MIDNSDTRTLLALDQRCYVCSRGPVLQEHHIVRRSQGGGDGPTVYLCQTCHDNITAERWDMWLDDVGLWVVETATGVIRSRRFLGVDPREAFDSLHLAREALECIPQFIPFMDNTQLAALFRELGDVGKRGWAAQCAIVYEALSYRFVYGTKMEFKKALAGALGISLPALEDYSGVWERFHERQIADDLEKLDGKTSYIIEASRHENADELLDHAIEEYGAGYYPVAKLRAEARGEDYEPRKCAWWSEGGGCERYAPSP